MPDSKTPKAPMTPADAARIQSHADKTGTNQDFKERAQGAVEGHARPAPKKP